MQPMLPRGAGSHAAVRSLMSFYRYTIKFISRIERPGSMIIAIAKPCVKAATPPSMARYRLNRAGNTWATRILVMSRPIASYAVVILDISFLSITKAGVTCWSAACAVML